MIHAIGFDSGTTYMPAIPSIGSSESPSMPELIDIIMSDGDMSFGAVDFSGLEISMPEVNNIYPPAPPLPPLSDFIVQQPGVMASIGWGLLQGVANTANGLQDMAVGFANLGLVQLNKTIWNCNKLGLEIPQIWIPSPDWSRGMFTEEYNGGWWTDTHGWSKWSGANGVMALVGVFAPKMTVSVGEGGPPSGVHFTFKVGDQWYHAAGRYGQQTISKVRDNPLTRLNLQTMETTKPWFTLENIPILSSRAATPVIGTPVMSCVTAATGTWVSGGGPIFIIAPVIHLVAPETEIDITPE